MICLEITSPLGVGMIISENPIAEILLCLEITSPLGVGMIYIKDKEYMANRLEITSPLGVGMMATTIDLPETKVTSRNYFPTWCGDD